MAESLLSSLKTDRVHRIDVNFEIPQKYLLVYLRKINLLKKNF